MSTTLQDYITFAQRHFNRREYEQFILPIIKLVEQGNVSAKAQLIRDPLLKYMNNCIARISNEKEILTTGEEIISIETVTNILNEERGLIL
jgi:hypothetical protein